LSKRKKSEIGLQGELGYARGRAGTPEIKEILGDREGRPMKRSTATRLKTNGKKTDSHTNRRMVRWPTIKKKKKPGKYVLAIQRGKL